MWGVFLWNITTFIQTNHLMKKLILERALPYNIFENFIVILVVLFGILSGLIAFTRDMIAPKITLTIFCFLLLLSLFVKKGLLVKNGTLYKSNFLFGITVFKSALNIPDESHLQVYSHKILQNYIGGKREPDMSYKLTVYELFFEHRTQKHLVFYASKEKSILMAKEFIIKEMNLATTFETE